jgi:hypothetical protein
MRRLLIIAGIALAHLSCNGCGLTRSPLEDKLHESEPELAVYVYCLRAMSSPDGRAGANVRDCEALLSMSANRWHYRECLKAGKGYPDCVKLAPPVPGK